MVNGLQDNRHKNTAGDFRIKPIAMYIRMALFGGLFLVEAPNAAAATPVLPVPANDWIHSGSATSQIIGDTLKIHQKSDKAALNWNSFNIGAKNQVKFEQPKTTSIALNRIMQGSPSQILGNLSANGQVYLVNQNGFLFGKNSTVNVNTLVASALNISDDVFNGGITKTYSKSQLAALDGPSDPATSAVPLASMINVEKGAKIQVGQNGRLIMAAPNVTNSGDLQTDKFGQIMLIASQDKVYLAEQNPSDTTNCPDCKFPGLLVEVGIGGTVNNTNLGNILARQGNVTLAGFAVNQNGRVSATTSAKVNGSIRLLAREGADTSQPPSLLPLSTGTVRQQDGQKSYAKVTLGSGSLTQVIADTDDAKAVDEQTQPQSYMQVSAHTVHMQANSTIHAPDGKVEIVASSNPVEPNKSAEVDPVTGLTIPPDGKIVMDSGALIDVSGAKNITASMTRNIVDVPVQSFELRNSPLQKGGVLQGKTVRVDIRNKTSIIDTSGAEKRIGRSTDERMARQLKGSVNLTAAGSVIVNPNASIDISGGLVNYQGGFINTTKLITDYGKIVDISQADPNEHYQSVLGVYKEVHEKWGVTKVWQTGGLSGQGNFEQGYLEGLDAGSLNMNTPRLSWNGKLVAGTESGLYQRSAENRPFGGEWLFNEEMSLNPSDKTSSFKPTQNIRFQKQGGSLNLNVGLPFPSADTGLFPDGLKGQATDLVLSTDMLNQSGIQKLVFKTTGNATAATDANLILKPKGEFSLISRNIDLQGDISSSGGAIQLYASQDFKAGSLSAGQVFAGLTQSDGKITFSPQASINVSGRWANDFALGINGGIPVEPTQIDAGAVSLVAASVAIPSGSVLKADGGAWLSQDDKLTVGKAGTVTIKPTKIDIGNGSIANSTLQLDGKLSAFGLNNGGTLTLNSPDDNLAVGKPDLNIPDASTFVLSTNNGHMNIDGITSFGAINLNAFNLTLKKQSALNLVQQNRILDKNYRQQASTDSIADFSTITTLPEYLRHPVDLTLTAEQDLKLETGSEVLGDKQAKITLASGGNLGSIYIDGLIDAPAGTVDAHFNGIDAGGNYALKTIWLGSHANLQARGSNLLNPVDGLGQRTGEVLAGGSINLTADMGHVIVEQGAKIDVSGSSATLDLVDNEPSGTHTVPTNVASDAGKIAIKASESIVLDGELIGHSSSATAAGGRLEVTLDPKDRATNGAPAHLETLTIRQDHQRRLAGGIKFGDNLDDPALGLSGTAQLSSGQFAKGGFTDVRLKVRDSAPAADNGIDTFGDAAINFVGDINLTAAARIDLDTPIVSWSAQNSIDQGRVTLNTAFLKAGSSDHTKSDPALLPVMGNGQFTANTKWMEFNGGSKWDGFASLNFNSSNDMRTVGHFTSELNEFGSKLVTAANINLAASQIYPSTLSNFTLAVDPSVNPNGQITVAKSGKIDNLPLSAGGVLNFEAPLIHQDGTIKAPFGHINLTAGKVLSLGNGSLTSVSGAGSLIPFGNILSGQNWVYPGREGIINSAPAPQAPIPVPPDKKLVLSAPEVTVAKGSTVDLSGGGDLLAYEFQPGIGGSSDYLGSFVPTDGTTPSYQGGFAILPGLGSALAPFDPLQASSSTYPGSIGSQVYLNGSNKLAAGFYTILPTHYALLPGAYLVTPQTGTEDQRLNSQTVAGLPIVSGYQSLAGSNTRDARWGGYLIEDGQDIRKHSQYNEQTANSFFTKGALQKEAAMPILPKDSGQIVIKGAQTKLALEGDFKVAASGGLGARMDIAANRLKIVKALGATPADGALEVLASNLSGLGVGSLLLGGERSSNSTTGVTDLDVTAKEIIIDSGAVLQGTDLIAAATDKIEVLRGAKLLASGSVKTGDKSLNVTSGNGALIRVSSDQQVTLTRQDATGETGDLLVEAGAILSANKSMLLDSSHASTLAGDIAMKGGSLNVSANRVNLGEVDSLLSADALNLSNADLAKLTADELILTSRGGLNLYGTLGLKDNTGVLKPVSFDHLVINAAGISGFGATDKVAGLKANSLILENTFSRKSTTKGNGFGQLDIAANSFNQGIGKFNISGFKTVEINAAQDFKAAGNGSLNIDGNLHLTSGYLTSAAGKKLDINVKGQAVLDNSSKAAQLPTIDEFGGSIGLTANSVAFNSTALLPSGSLSLHSNTGNVDVGANANINLAGQKIPFADSYDYTPGGTFNAEAGLGKITLALGSIVDVNSGGGTEASGKLNFKASKQSVGLLGGINAQGGSAALDVADFGPTKDGFDKLMDSFMTAGVSETLTVRSRQAGIGQGAGQSIHAKNIKLASDQGDVHINGRLDANSTEGGGSIKLYAGDKVILDNGAVLNAKGTGSLAKGGNVLLSTTDVDKDNSSGIAVNSGSLIDVAGANGQGGEVMLRALRTANNKDVAIKPIAGTVHGFNHFYAEGVKKYTNDDLGNDHELNATDIAQIKQDTVDFTPPATMQNVNARLGKGIRLRPGIEIDYNGDLALKDEWDFLGWRYSESAAKSVLPGGLSISTSGNFTVQNSLTDGFKTETQTAEALLFDNLGNPVVDENFNQKKIPVTKNKDILQSNDSWSYQLTAGADLASADINAVSQDAKNITLTAKSSLNQLDPNQQSLGLLSTVVRTGTGNIEMTASGDVVFDSGKVLDTAGSAVLDPTKPVLDASTGTVVLSPFIYTTSIYTAGKSLSGSTYGADIDSPELPLGFVDYPGRGGNLSLNAGHDIKGSIYQKPTINEWLVVQGGLQSDGFTNEPTSWGVDFAKFNQNVGVFGGGHAHVNAGNAIDDLAVMMPTVGKQLSAHQLQIDGGGQMQVSAGSNINGGIYLLGKGKGTLISGGAISGTRNNSLDPTPGTDSGTPASMADITKGPQLLMGDTQLDLSANQGISISGVSDPIMVDDTNTNFFTYGPSSAISAKSLAGDIQLNADSGVLTNGISAINNATNKPDFSRLYPGSLYATAFGGSISKPMQQALESNAPIILMPSLTSNLVLLAKGDIASRDPLNSLNVSMSDTDPLLLPDALRPTSDLSAVKILANDHAQRPVHRDDQVPVRIVAQQGNIEGINLNLAKKALISSGHDIKNSTFAIQHANLSGDVSTVSAGRDINFTGNPDPNTGGLGTSNSSISVGGSGELLVKAGRNIDLGTSDGITSVGNLSNPNLPKSGANLTVIAGLNGAKPDYLGFAKLNSDVLKYADNYSKYQQAVTEYIRNRTGNTKMTVKTAFQQFNQLDPTEIASFNVKQKGLESNKYKGVINQIKQTMVDYIKLREHNPTLTEANALAAFSQLSPEEYLSVQAQLNNLANQILFAELNATGAASAADPSVGNQRGFDAIQALYPGDTWKGDLSLAFSQIQTQQDGNITLLAPGGKINVGLPVPGVAKTSDQLGVIARGKGAVSIFLDKDLNVNQSRIFALGGDDIMVWSSHGDIDAGRGAKSAFAVSNPQYSFDENGNLGVEFPAPVAGSGLRTAAPPDNSNAKAGNVGLFAPGGIVNAAEAGIGGNNVTISATAVLGANNIQVGGVSTGVPAASTVSLAAGLTGVSNLTANVSQMAEASADMTDKKGGSGKQKNQLSTINVEFIGFGA